MANDQLDKTLVRLGGEKLSLQEGVYTNQSFTALEQPIPRWMPDHPEPLWHSGLGQEVRIVGINESASVIQYRIRILNSSDTQERIALEFQLQELSEADRVVEGQALPINKAPWAPLKEAMLTFLRSYPVSAEDRQKLEVQIKSKNKGLATAIIDERQAEQGAFAGTANFVDRMNQRSPGFPWDAIAPTFDYTLPNR